MHHAKNKSQSPIGVYDSGIGGLTIVHALAQQLPNEDIIYFGDTAHLPYGEKSESAIQNYSKIIIQFLLEKKCKIIVVACHSASSACYTRWRAYAREGIRIINVIDPMVEYIANEYQGKRVGLIGTKRTVFSKVYHKALSRLQSSVQLVDLATPLLAPMIEEGFFKNRISHEVVKQYLSNPRLANIDCLTLACTHYPMIKPVICSLYNHAIPILDSSESVAYATAVHLKKNALLNASKHLASRCFFVSDYTQAFEACAQVFFGESIKLIEHKI